MRNWSASSIIVVFSGATSAACFLQPRTTESKENYVWTWETRRKRVSFRSILVERSFKKGAELIVAQYWVEAISPFLSLFVHFTSVLVRKFINFHVFRADPYQNIDRQMTMQDVEYFEAHDLFMENYLAQIDRLLVENEPHLFPDNYQTILISSNRRTYCQVSIQSIWCITIR